MRLEICLVLLISAAVVSASPRCTGSPRMFNGKHCASTTRYADYHKGACGCGPDNNDNQLPWNHDGFVVAANQHLFDGNGGSWCGATCGKCIKLTTTGGFVDGQGSAPPAGQSHVFMITNLCPNEYPNLSWCSQSSGNGFKNQYGYGYHFDLENGANQIAGLGWNNPEVTWEWADCNQAHNHDHRTPSSNMYTSQCYCGKHPGK